MTPLHRLARRASRRLVLARFVRTLGIALPITLALGALTVLGFRLIGPSINWWWIGAGAVALALVTSVGVAWHSRKGMVDAAAEVDTALKLKDRLASGLALESRTKDDPFASIALDEASTLASRISIHHAIPVRPERTWWWWPVTAAAFLGIGIFVPHLRLLQNREERLAAIEQTAAQQKTEKALDIASKKLEDALGPSDPETGDFELSKELSKLQQLQDQMQAGLKDPKEAAAEAASQIDELAQQLDNRAAEAEAADNASKDLLDQAAKDLAPEPGTEEVDRLIEAMRKGEMEEAAKAAEALEKAAENMSEEDAAKAADRLQNYADAVDRAAHQASQNASDQAQKSAQDMANRGLSQDAASKLAQNANAGASQSDLEKQLQQQGMSQEAAREMAKKISEAAKNQRASNQACKNAGECSSSMREGAKGIKECKGGSSSLGEKPGQKGVGSKPGNPGTKPGENGTPGDGECENPGAGQGKGGNAQADGKKSWEVTPGQPTTGAGRGTALHNLKQKLTGSAKATRTAQQAQHQAQELRVTKEDLLRQLADKSFKEKQLWLQQQLAQGHQDKNWKYADAPMDVREGVNDGQVIAQQHTPGDTPLPYNPGRISNRELTTELSAAMEATERAIEDRVIPSRYRNIQRYFQKSIQRSKAAEPASPAAPAPDAADAPAKKN